MKLSEYHKAHTINGVLRSRQTGTELHFNLEPGQMQAPLVLDVGGHMVEGYIQLQRRHGLAEDNDLDMTFALRLGEQPDIPDVVLGVKPSDDISKDARFNPGPAPNLNPLPAPKVIELPRKPIDRFDPGEGPELSTLPEARVFVPSAPDEEEDDGAGPSEVERAMAQEFAPPAEKQAAEKEEKKEVKEEKKEGRKEGKKLRP